MTWEGMYRLFIAVITSLGGGATIVWLMSGWLGKVWAKRIEEETKSKFAKELEDLKQQYSLDLEKLRAVNNRVSQAVQAEFDRTVYVTKANFDVELDALRMVWKQMKALQLALNALRDKPIPPPGESPQQRAERLHEKLSRDMKAFADTHNDAMETVENQRPFYPKTIYEAANQAIEISLMEYRLIPMDRDRRFSQGWYDEGSKCKDEFQECMSTLEQGIRNRMEKLAIRA